MARFPRGRKSQREQRLESLAGQSFYALMAPEHKRAAAEAELAAARNAIPPAPKPRAPRKPSGKPLERDVLKAITQALRWHPKVASVERNQSGVFKEGDRYIQVGTRGKLDLTVYLRDGTYAEIEVKRPGEKPKPHQQARIESIRRKGGKAGWADSVEAAIAIIEG